MRNLSDEILGGIGAGAMTGTVVVFPDSLVLTGIFMAAAGAGIGYLGQRFERDDDHFNGAAYWAAAGLTLGAVFLDSAISSQDVSVVDSTQSAHVLQLDEAPQAPAFPNGMTIV